jgi:HD-like signal output (HDOD) protein/ActR/RegA family two-component response regulator
MPSKTALFVDDEPLVLNGLRRMLSPFQKDWTLLFAESGVEGLNLLENNDVNILIADMRMPGMNGLELLQTARKCYPQVIRVMLTGQPDKDIYCDVLALSHYFLWKPAKFEDLKMLFDCIRDLDSSFFDKKLLRLIGRIDSLPSLPVMFNRLMVLIGNSDSTIEQIAGIINKDISMSAQILKLVNSSYCKLPYKRDSIHEAVAYLGINILKQLVMSQHLITQYTESEVKKFEINEIWKHSIRTALVAKDIARKNNHSISIVNSSYLSGLIHDIGKLTIIRCFPELYAEILEKTKQQGRSQSEVETEHLGFNHAIIGGHLTSLWGLPHSITDAITFHHEPSLNLLTNKISPVREALWHADRICKGDYSQSENYHDVAAHWHNIPEK